MWVEESSGKWYNGLDESELDRIEEREKIMKTKKQKMRLIVGICLICIVFVFLIATLNLGITELIDRSNLICRGQSFSSVSDAVKGMNDEINPDDTSIDYTNYKLLTSFEYDEFTVIMCSYQEAINDECIIRILRTNNDGTLSFVGGFTDFLFSQPYNENMNYYYYTNVKTSHGKKAIAFIYLPKETESNVYIDNRKTEKILVQIDEKEFYVCTTMLKQDTFLKDLFVPIGKRHTVTLSDTDNDNNK